MKLSCNKMLDCSSMHAPTVFQFKNVSSKAALNVYSKFAFPLNLNYIKLINLVKNSGLSNLKLLN